MKPLKHKVKQRIMEVKKMYDALGSQPAVARKLGLTRQRISQMLQKGKKHGLFSFSSHYDEELKAVISKYTRDRLLSALSDLEHPSKMALRKKLRIGHKMLEGLLRHFAITEDDIQSVKKAGLTRQRLKAYYDMVDAFGYHPRFSEFYSSKKWRNVSAGLEREWGGLRNFRKTFGIVPRKSKVAEKLILTTRKFLIKKRKKKHAKKQKIVGLLKNQGAHSASQLSKALGYSLSLSRTYLSELTKERKTRRIGAGNKVRYLIVKPHKKKRK